MERRSQRHAGFPFPEKERAPEKPQQTLCGGGECYRMRGHGDRVLGFAIRHADRPCERENQCKDMSKTGQPNKADLAHGMALTALTSGYSTAVLRPSPQESTRGRLRPTLSSPLPS